MATKSGDYYLLWSTQRNLEIIPFICGSCGRRVTSGKGYDGTEYSSLTNAPTARRVYVRICPYCASQIYFNVDESQSSGPVAGSTLRGTSYQSVERLYKLYNEACRCTNASAFTACVLCCQTILVNIALSKGARKGLKFAEYVHYLLDKGYVPPEGKRLIGPIRERWDNAPPAPSIEIIKKGEAETLLSFTEILLKHVFEFPGSVQEVP